MGVARFSNDGYEYLDASSYVLFTADSHHFHLFDYIEKDLSSLPELMETYISGILNLTTFRLRNSEGDSNTIPRIQELLSSCHAYYAHECDKTIVEAIGAFFNRLLVYVGLDRSQYPTGHIFQRQWYHSRISKLIPGSLLRNGEYPPGCSPDELYKEYYDWVSCPPSIDGNHVEEYVIEGVPKERPIPFSDELRTQAAVSNMLYFILDSSAKGMDKLSVEQRYWLYGNVFGYSYNCSGIEVTQRLSFFPLSRFQGGYDRSREADYLCKLDDLFRPLYKLSGLNVGRNGIPKEMDAPLSAAIGRAESVMTARVYEEYKIDNLEQLLYLEIMSMIHSGTVIRRCRNCGKYFVQKDLKRVYCGRMDKAGTSCAAIGRRTSFQRKMKQEPELASYNRAYKARFARLKNKRMDRAEFEKWSREAKGKLKQVRDGELDPSIFQEWLKN